MSQLQMVLIQTHHALPAVSDGLHMQRPERIPKEPTKGLCPTPPDSAKNSLAVWIVVSTQVSCLTVLVPTRTTSWVLCLDRRVSGRPERFGC